MLDVVGIPASGWPDLAPDSQALVAGASLVYGSQRQLDLLPDSILAERRPWPTPLHQALSKLTREIETTRVVVLASGDPLVSGIGTTLQDAVGTDRVRIHPAVSSAALARARMGWSAERSDIVTLVGRNHDQIRRWLAPGAQLILLSSDERSPARIADIVKSEGYGSSRLHILGDIGTAEESRTELIATQKLPTTVPRLNIVCLECELDEGTVARSVAPGLSVDCFEHDGQITKPIVRAAALAALAPSPGQTLWDLGAGAGSVAIEWCRLHPRNTAVAVERDTERARRIRRNASQLGVAPQVEVVAGHVNDFVVDETQAPRHATGEIPDFPDAVFCGGGVSAELLDTLVDAAHRGARIVAHAVTVESEAVLLAALARHGGQLQRLSIEQVQELGEFHGFAPARTVTQWAIRT